MNKGYYKPWYISFSTRNSGWDIETASSIPLFDKDLTVTDNGDGTATYQFTVDLVQNTKRVQVGIIADDYGMGMLTYTLP